MQLCFEQLTGNQVRLLKMSGKCVRMDSKLIDSNIAHQSRYELIPHDEDGLTIREIATGNTYEIVKTITKQGSRKRWRIPWNNKTSWRYFEDKDIKAYQLRKQIESLPLEEQHKRNNEKLPCSNTVFIHVMARPNIGACSNIVCMHIAEVCG